MTRPTIVFFARGYQADFFPTLESERFAAVFVTLTRAERRRVEARGRQVAACFEEEFESLPVASVPANYLATSLASDRFLGCYGYARRHEILGKEIAFWRRLFERHTPLAVVNELVAIEISEVLLIECRARGIHYLAGMNCVVEDEFYWLRNPLSLSGRHLEQRVPGEAARAAARRYLEHVTLSDYQPFYVKNLHARRALLPLAVALAKFVLWSWRGLRARWGAFRYERYDDEYGKKVAVYFKSLYRRYDTLAALPQGREVIFYPLHQEPEATLNYMSEFYANQVATIENILKCLTVDQVLVVKEHPVDKGALLRRKFQALKSSCSGLYYLPAEVHGREVLARSQRVVTLTSTLGWEGAILGKKVYVLGQIFYDSFPGVTALADFAQLKRELRTPAGPPRADLEAVAAFVANMSEQSYPGNPFPHPALYSDGNRRRVVEAIERAVGL